MPFVFLVLMLPTIVGCDSILHISHLLLVVNPYYDLDSQYHTFLICIHDVYGVGGGDEVAAGQDQDEGEEWSENVS